jgi:NADH dehydrogenase
MALILVTGATGFLGRHVVQLLKGQGEEVRCLVRPHSNVSHLRQQNAELVVGDVTEPATLSAAAQGVDAVVHLVAVIRERRGRGITFLRVNHQGTRNIVQAAKEAGVSRFVHMGAIGTRNDPRFRYLTSKWLGEQEVINSDIPSTVLRASIIVGEGDQFITTLARLVKWLPIVPVVGDGRTRFQYIWARDVAKCLALCLQRESTIGKTLEIGGPEHLTYDQTVDTLAKMLGKRRLKLHIPVPLMVPIVKVMERLFPNPPITSEELKMVKLDNITTLDAVENSFEFAPRRLAEVVGYIKKV